MKQPALALVLLISLPAFSQRHTVITNDIVNFWKAYDQVTQTTDTLKQVELINAMYINVGTPGLKAIMQARNYTPQSYVSAINRYPEFWASIRHNTFKADSCAKALELEIDELKKIYPYLKPANIYFTVGALRTGGTALGDKVLIGSEVAMANNNVETHELEKDYPHLPRYFKTNPADNINFLVLHEFIHTQQQTTIGNTLLARAVIEGTAEFVAEKAGKKASPNPQIAYGTGNDHKLKTTFAREMFWGNEQKWFWSNANNEFGMGDLGYYIGYAICAKYYNDSKNKKQAIKEMIELDYNNEKALSRFVDKSAYFDKPIMLYKEEFEKTRPTITAIEQFANGSQEVSPSIKIITLQFSQPMDSGTRGFDYGPLGESNVLSVQRVIGFSEDKKSFSYEVNLKPNSRYQVLVSDRFRDEKGLPLKPYLIDIKTSGN